MIRGLLNRFGRWLDRESSTGDVFVVRNTGKHSAANLVYHAARLRKEGLRDPELCSCYLFTGHEMEQARKRALRNMEDVPWCANSCECASRLELS